VLLEEPGRYASSFLRLRANVELANAVNGGPVILVTSVSGGELESKSVTVANTGLALARAGHRVVLVDLDLHHRSLAQVFRLPPEPGITDVLLGRSTLDEALRQVGPYPDLEAAPHRWPRRRRSRAETLGYIRVGGALDVLTLGTVPANPADVVGTRALAALVEHLRRRADIVLLDTPPLLQSAEAIAVSPLADSVAVVVRVGQERRAALGEARRLLDLSPVAKLGFVATGSAVRPGRTHDGEADRHYRDLQRELVS
jgi:Mrp family chromosome partitioning ATPase